MSEIDALIAGAVGGSISAMCVAYAVLLHIKYVYDQKIMYLRMQIIGLQAINGINNDD